MKNLAVICGGYSSEYEISLKSGSTIANAISGDYSAHLVVLTKDGCQISYEESKYEFDLRDLSFNSGKGKISLDAAIIYIHGNPGENGKLQGLFDMYDVSYINSGALASELSFDKWYCNQFLQNFSVKVAQSQLLLKGESYDGEAILKRLGLPVFVKPCDSGSSFGISKVNKASELDDAISEAFAEGDSLVIEAFLDGTEVTCGVYNSSNGIIALPLAEIVSENEFFDYEAKYLGKSQEIVPARIDDVLTKKVQEIAKRIYSLLRLRSIARIDFMIVNGEPYVIEVNTTPGFTSESLVPRMIRAEDKTLSEFWTEVLDFETKRITERLKR